MPVHAEASQAGRNTAADATGLPPAAGQVVARAQHVAGVNFSYQPPPRHLVPFAAALKAPPYANHRYSMCWHIANCLCIWISRSLDSLLALIATKLEPAPRFCDNHDITPTGRVAAITTPSVQASRRPLLRTSPMQCAPWQASTTAMPLSLRLVPQLLLCLGFSHRDQEERM